MIKLKNEAGVKVKKAPGWVLLVRHSEPWRQGIVWSRLIHTHLRQAELRQEKKFSLCKSTTWFVRTPLS